MAVFFADAEEPGSVEKGGLVSKPLPFADPTIQQTLKRLVRLAASTVLEGTQHASIAEIEARARALLPSRRTSAGRKPFETLIAGCQLLTVPRKATPSKSLRGTRKSRKATA